MKSHPVIFIAGPTAVGKSAFSLLAAEQFSGVILNCDSVQTYAHVRIGAAKPDLETQARVPHYLLDWVEPPHHLTAAEFRREALEKLATLTQNHPVFAVGGSGFYLRALQKGLYPVRKVSAELSRLWQEKLKQKGSKALYEELKKLDPDYAQRLSPNDGYRVVRALETIESEGRPITDIQNEFAAKATPFPYRMLKIGFELPRAVLRERIAARANDMIRQGLRHEVQGLINQGLQEWAPLKSVGYKEMVQGILQNHSDQQVVEKIIQSTSQLAKKQMTWFRGDSEIHWFSPGPPWTEPMAMVREFLALD